MINAFLTVNFNNSLLTIDCFQSYKKNQYADSSFFIVVDNHSNNDEIAILIDYSEKNPDFILLLSKCNLGYFNGLNLALDYIKPKIQQIENVIIGNNDLFYESNFTEVLKKTEYQSDAMVICPNVITKDGYHQNPHHKVRLSKFKIFLFDLYFINYYLGITMMIINALRKKMYKSSRNVVPDKIVEIYMGVGACYVLKPLFFSAHTHLFFPGFLYGEEACLTYQVQSSGCKLYFDPNLLVAHEESATLSKLPKIQTYKFGRDSYWKFRDILNYDY